MYFSRQIFWYHNLIYLVPNVLQLSWWGGEHFTSRLIIRRVCRRLMRPMSRFSHWNQIFQQWTRSTHALLSRFSDSVPAERCAHCSVAQSFRRFEHHLTSRSNCTSFCVVCSIHQRCGCCSRFSQDLRRPSVCADRLDLRVSFAAS